jgi:hypothetical protein
VWCFNVRVYLLYPELFLNIAKSALAVYSHEVQRWAAFYFIKITFPYKYIYSNLITWIINHWLASKSKKSNERVRGQRGGAEGMREWSKKGEGDVSGRNHNRFTCYKARSCLQLCKMQLESCSTHSSIQIS